MSRITHVVDPDNTFPIRATLECWKWDGWDIQAIEMCVGDKWIAVRDSELRAAIEAQLMNCKFFIRMADDAHVEAFDAPDTAWENYFDHIKEQAHG